MAEREVITEQFSRASTCYQQNFLQFRSLNEQMNRVPTVAITLTGGLWYAATLTHSMDHYISFGLIFFAGISNISLILSAYRIRDVMTSYLEKIKEYDPTSYVSGTPISPSLPRFGNYSMISIYSLLMGSGALLSFIGACFFYSPVGRFSSWIIFLLTVGVIIRCLARLFWGRKINVNAI